MGPTNKFISLHLNGPAKKLREWDHPQWLTVSINGSRNRWSSMAKESSRRAWKTVTLPLQPYCDNKAAINIVHNPDFARPYITCLDELTFYRWEAWRESGMHSICSNHPTDCRCSNQGPTVCTPSYQVGYDTHVYTNLRGSVDKLRMLKFMGWNKLGNWNPRINVRISQILNHEVYLSLYFLGFWFF